jgi:hypothetical protein
MKKSTIQMGLVAAGCAGAVGAVIFAGMKYNIQLATDPVVTRQPG